jgi:hypothetical protein
VAEGGRAEPPRERDEQEEGGVKSVEKGRKDHNKRGDQVEEKY